MHLRTLQYRIGEEEEGLRVETFLRARGYSKNVIVHLRNTDAETGKEAAADGAARLFGLSINGEKVYTTRALHAGEKLTVKLLETACSENIVAREIPLQIVYEDEDLMVINKQAGLPIHPSQGNYDNTLGNALAWYAAHVLKQERFVYRVINRLDRDTTGLLIVAKNMLAAAVLGQAVAARGIHREYRALCQGLVEDGCICAPIARADGSTIERCVDFARGERAVTHVQRLSYNAALDLSLVRLALETGRTHQIRVHMKYVGHPLPGDFLYNPDFEQIGRQALHSAVLEFRHPVTGRQLHFEAALPEDMARLV